MNGKKALFYQCPLGHGNYTSRKCGKCGMTCKPVYPEDIPPERNWETDPSYLDYVLRQSRKERENSSEIDEGKDKNRIDYTAFYKMKESTEDEHQDGE